MPQGFSLVGKQALLETDSVLTHLSVTNTCTGTRWSLCQPDVSLVEVHLGNPADREAERVLDLSEIGIAPVQVSRRALLLAGEAIGIRVKIVITVSPRGHFHWTLLLSNHGSAEVRDVLIAIQGLTPSGGGFGFTLPVNNGWLLPYDSLELDEALTWNYPIFGSMQWVDFGNEDEGIYIGCHDRVPLIKLMTAGKRQGKGNIGVRFSDMRLRPGESVELPPLVIAPHFGDWRVGARIYSDWAMTWMERPDIPEWVLRKPHWAWMGLKGQFASKPDRTYADLPKEAVEASAHGINVLQVGGWLEHGHDTRYPDYVAGESLGGESGLIEAVHDIHACGGRIALYTNGRIVDPESSLGHISGWQKWAVHGLTREHTSRMQRLHANFDLEVPDPQQWDEAGVIAKEKYGIDFAVMCPSCAEWRSLFVDRLCDLAEKYDVDGIYVDQVCGCWSYPCYADGHDHRFPYESWAGYVDMLRELRRRLRAINPEIYLSTEGVGDIFGQFFDMLQGHNDWDSQVGQKALPMPELFRYTFPWLVVCTGPLDYRSPDFLKLAHLVGSGFDFCTMPAKSRFREVLSRSRQVLEWRELFWREMVYGEVLGPCKTSHPDYRAFAFVGEARLVVTVAWLPWKQKCRRPKSVDLSIPCECHVSKVTLLTETGQTHLEHRKAGGAVELSFPFAEIGLIVLEEDSAMKVMNSSYASLG